jgi:hypothetical protein
LRERGQRRCRPERDHPEGEEALAAKSVAQHAKRDQQAGEDQRVGVHRPLHLALRRAQVLLNRLQRDVQDGVVEDDDEQADNQHAEDAPAPPVNGVRVHEVLNSDTVA